MWRAHVRAAGRGTRRAVNLPIHVQEGLTSLVQGNEVLLRSMLDNCPEEALTDIIVQKIREFMGVAKVGVAALLVRFFPDSVLRQYCTEKLVNVSSKGSLTVLADRIFPAWSRAKSEHSSRGAVKMSNPQSSSKPTQQPSEKRRAKLKKRKKLQDDHFLEKRFCIDARVNANAREHEVINKKKKSSNELPKPAAKKSRQSNTKAAPEITITHQDNSNTNNDDDGSESDDDGSVDSRDNSDSELLDSDPHILDEIDQPAINGGKYFFE